MRIIAGKFRGRHLQAPRGANTRPTADHVRESVFNLLSTRFSIEGATVLDLFCGTGAFGLEAISRGASAASFVDMSRAALKTATGNAESLGVESMCRFLQRDWMRYLKHRSTPEFDVIFADPPYHLPSLMEIPALALEKLSPGGLFVLEHDRRHRFDDREGEIESRSYGRTIVTIFHDPPATQNRD